MQKAVDNVNQKLAEAVLGENALNQIYIDQLLIEADGTANKEHIGANAILGVSMATARACAKALRCRFINIWAAAIQRGCPFR